MIKTPKSPAEVPEVVPIFPLSGALLLPGTNRPLNIFEPRYLALVDHSLATSRLIGLIQPEHADVESPPGNVPLQHVGCLGRLNHFEETEENRYFIVLEGLTRFEYLEDIPSDTGYRLARISTARYAGDFDPDAGEELVDRVRFIKMMREYADYAGLDIDWNEIEQTGTADLVNLACMLSPYGPAEKQVLLEAATLNSRAETLIAMAEIEMVRGRSGNTLQ